MRIAVVGAGTMGAGIAQLTAMAGHETALVDLDEAQLGRARAAAEKSLERFVRKETLTEAAAKETLGRLTLGTDLAAAAAGVDVVVESVVEVLSVKQEVLRTVATAAPGALLGTNTSQLSITQLASAVPDHASRVVGLHFFNPPVLMRLVEVVAGLQTSEETLAQAVAFGEGLGKETVVCRKDSPGFLTSRISALVRLECLRMLEEGVASAADIDKALKIGFNWPMGPLELGDFNGLDTNLSVMEGMTEAYGERFRPPAAFKTMVLAGMLGRKTGAGFYDYPETEEDRG